MTAKKRPQEGGNRNAYRNPLKIKGGKRRQWK